MEEVEGRENEKCSLQFVHVLSIQDSLELKLEKNFLLFPVEELPFYQRGW